METEASSAPKKHFEVLSTHQHCPSCPSDHVPHVPSTDTDTSTSEHSCVSETTYREISAFYKRNYNKSVAPTPCPPLPTSNGPGGGSAHARTPGRGQWALYLQDSVVTCGDSMGRGRHRVWGSGCKRGAAPTPRAAPPSVLPSPGAGGGWLRWPGRGEIGAERSEWSDPLLPGVPCRGEEGAGRVPGVNRHLLFLPRVCAG